MKTFILYKIDFYMGIRYDFIAEHQSYTYEEAFQYFKINMVGDYQYLILIK